MTNEKKIAELINIRDNFNYTLTPREVFDEAIKALEQGSVLDKIKAEIEALSNANPSYWHSGDMVDRDEVLEILDKYREESEGV